MGDWTPPAAFEEYRLVRLLGRGAMGEVHLARDELLDRLVAIKFVAGVEPDGARRERFLVEARAIARLSHPNVVAVHRVGETHKRPYLVSEFVRGEPLDKLARPVAWRSVLMIGIGLARGLAAAHRHGVLHRDIKPANAILTEEGEAKLLDFGLAQLLDAVRPSENDSAGNGSAKAVLNEPAGAETRSLNLAGVSSTQPVPARAEKKGGAPAIVGTPLYLAPEIWRGEPATRRSDVYSLGILLYELCTGSVPGKGLTLGELAGVEGRRAIAPVASAVPGIDLRFASVIDRCLEAVAERRFESGDALRGALERLIPRAPAPLTLPGQPYRGLYAFDAEHRDVFFGRGGDVRALLDRLRADPVVLVAGDSGVGKSSLCRAGVLPLVEEGVLADGLRWTTARLVPGRRPLAALASALAAASGADEAALAKFLHETPAAAASLLRQSGDTRARILIFVDQSEELVTLADAKQAAAFLGALDALTAAGLRLIATIRSDFLTRFAALADSPDWITRALYLLQPLSESGLRDAIVEPAQAHGVNFESEALVDALVAAAGRTGGSLPLLQFTLAELWDARDVERHVIAASALESLRGVAGALARHADGVLAALLPAQRAAARRLLLRLVTPDGTRVRRGERELVGEGTGADPDARAALQALVRGRLLVAGETSEAGEGAYELAHEALLTGWDSLRAWLDDDAERRVVRHRLQLAAAEWKRLGRAPEALFNERQLNEAAQLDAVELLPDETRFLAASRGVVRRRRWLRIGAILALPLTASLVYGSVKLIARRNLGRQIAERAARAEKIVDGAHAANVDTEALRARAFAAFDAGDLGAAEPLWSQALALATRVEHDLADASQLLEEAVLLDPARADSRRRFTGVLYDRALLAERDHHVDQRDDLVRRMFAWDADGEYQRRWTAPAHVAIATDPNGAQVSIQRFADDHGKLKLGAADYSLAAPVEDLALAPGSYLVRIESANRPDVRYPLLLARGERTSVSISIPNSIPEHFIYVPPGRFLYGSDDDERVRGILGDAPLHEMKTGAYLIARTETTYADWLRYLRALPPAERELRQPRIENRFGALSLALTDGGWELSLQPRQQRYRAREGERLRYLDRARRAEADWLALPVAGVSWEDAQAYVRWLADSATLPGARLCSEVEWERAARGADARLYPTGDHLDADDANYDATYGRLPRAFGPDEVGAHPASDSPFGVADLAGNVWEWMSAIADPKEVVYRGGSYYQDAALSARIDNRQTGERTMKTALIGLRVCADVK